MIRLRPYKPADAFCLVKWWEDAGEEEFVMWSSQKFSYPLAIEELDGYFSKWCLREERGWLMTAMDESGKPIGHFLIRQADYQSQSVRLGFIVVDPGVRGKGYGMQMIKQALDYVFHILGMTTAELTVFADNVRAKECYESAGFREKRFLTGYVKTKKKVYDAWEMEARADDSEKS